MGTPDFAVPTLEALLSHHDVAAVFTAPDRPRGRGRSPVPSPVKTAALAHGISVEQPVSLSDDGASTLRPYSPGVVVVAAYGQLLPSTVLEVPILGCVNVHPSLLPRHRGAAPIQRAILAGDEVTGVSIMRMVEELDAGPVAATILVDVDEKGAGDLGDELAEAGASALLCVLDAMERGDVAWVPQDGSLVTYAEKVSAADVALDPSLGTDDALRRVRASGATAPCRVVVDGRSLVVHRARRSQDAVPPGRAETAGKLVLGLSDGAIVVEELTPKDRSRMPATDYVRGARLDPEVGWGGPA